MIQRTEIDEVAAKLQVRPADVERDYVFGWLLSKIYGNSPLASRLVLKGGNALRKGYFPNTRYSPDLDFITRGKFAPEDLREQLLKVCDSASEACGVTFLNDQAVVRQKDRVAKDLDVLEAKLYFRDFYGKSGNVFVKTQLDVTQFAELTLPPSSRPLIHQYSDGALCTASLQCVALSEILASKLKCLLQRRHVADLFDYAHWLAFSPEQVNLAEVLRVFLRQTIYQRSPRAAFALLMGLPLQTLKDAWSQHIAAPIQAALDFEEAVRRFIEHLRILFSGYTEDWNFDASAFFPPEIRNVILEAGSRLTLLRMDYEGSERLVEPYSLKYRVKKDGVGREYFYGHCVSGSSRPPGIRMFVADKIETMSVTDNAFRPRHEVEVAKAGDEGQAGTLSRGGARRQIPAFGITRGRRRATGPRYLFRCGVCQRAIVKSKFDSQIGPHKRRRSKVPCSGRHGIWAATR